MTFQFTVGLIVANLTVLVGWIFRLRNDDDENNKAPVYWPSTVVFKTRHRTDLSMESFSSNAIVVNVDVSFERSSDQISPKGIHNEGNTSNNNSVHTSFASLKDTSLLQEESSSER